jgi:hypothetical protein
VCDYYLLNSYVFLNVKAQQTIRKEACNTGIGAYSRERRWIWGKEVKND